MKKQTIIRLFALAIMSVFAISAVSFAKDKTSEPCNEAKIKTSAFSFMCQNKIESSLKKIDGVFSAQLNLEDKTVTVVYNPAKTNGTKLQQKIEDLGYNASLITDKASLNDKSDNESKQ